MPVKGRTLPPEAEETILEMIRKEPGISLSKLHGKYSSLSSNVLDIVLYSELLLKLEYTKKIIRKTRWIPLEKAVKYPDKRTFPDGYREGERLQLFYYPNDNAQQALE